MSRSTSTRMLRLSVSVAVAATLTAAVAVAGDERDGARFSDFTPLAVSAGPTTNEAVPITFGSDLVEQVSIIDADTQRADGKPNSGNFDMNTVNETGRDKGRFLFTVFETSQAGVQRYDRNKGVAETIWFAPSEFDAVAFDASYWTPWGTFITAEESWATAVPGAPVT